MKILKATLIVLVLTVGIWIALQQMNIVVLGVCAGLCLTSILGLLSLKRVLFTLPLLALTTILVYTIPTTPSKELTAQIAQTLQFLIIIFAVEAGLSMISFNKILKRLGGQTPPLAMTKAIKRYISNLTAITTASFTLTALLLSLGSMAKPKLEPAVIVATATTTLFATLMFLALNLRHPKTKGKEKPKTL